MHSNIAHRTALALTILGVVLVSATADIPPKLKDKSKQPPPVRQTKKGTSQARRPPPAYCSCTFYVRTAEGGPAKGAKLSRQRGKGWVSVALGRTISLPYGTYKFRAEAEGCVPKSFPRTFRTKNVTVTFPLALSQETKGPAVLALGSLSPEDAVIKVNGYEKSAGDFPLKLQKGSVTLAVSMEPTHKTWTQTRNLAAGETWSTGDITLEELKARFRLSVEPSDARATLNGGPIAPGIVYELVVGVWTLEVCADGYRCYSEVFEVADASERSMSVKLEKIPEGWISVEVSPSDAVNSAQVSVGNQQIILGSKASVSPGEHRVIVTAEGYEPFSTNVTVNDGETVVVPAALKKAIVWGTIDISVDPSDSEVYVDGLQESAGKQELSEGEHDILVLKEDYIEEKRTVSITRDQPLTLNIVLKKQYYAQALELCEKINGELDLAYEDNYKDTKVPHLLSAADLCDELLALVSAQASSDSANETTWTYARWCAYYGKGVSQMEYARVHDEDPDYLRQAEVTLREATKADDERAVSHHALAIVLTVLAKKQKHGDLSEAESECRRAAALDPENGRIHADLSWILYYRGNKREAKEEANKALSLGAAPDSVPKLK